MSDSKLFGMKAESGRWLIIALGFIINICLGSVYAYSVFRNHVRDGFDITDTAAGMPFMIFLATFSIMVFVGGQLIPRIGPRNTGLLGGALVGIGWMLAGQSTNIAMLTVFYGIIGGGGVGLAYGAPLAVVGRWFPDKRGLALGLTLAGFGGSPFISANVASALIASSGPFQTFFILGLAFLFIICVLFLPFRYPADDWKPAEWAPAAGTTAVNYSTAEMLKTKTFYGLFITYTIGCLAGLMAIGISSPVAEEIIKIDPAKAAILVGVFAIFNGAGRPLFGTLTDKLSPKNAAVITFVVILLASIGMLNAGEGNVALYVICFAGFWLCLGGWLAIAPTATNTFFGVQNYAKNYGVIYLSYGLGAIIGGIIAGQVRDLLGAYSAAFWPTAGLAILGIIVALTMLNPPEKK